MRTRFAFPLLLSLVLLTACEVLGTTDPDPLDVEQMQLQYRVSGGWIHTSHLLIQPPGEARAERVGHGSGEIVNQGMADLTAEERDRLAHLLAWFPSYRRSYEPEQYYTDGNTYEIILKYEGKIDTVSTYGPPASLPRSLMDTMVELDGIYRRILP